MNKLFTKIASLTLGLALAAGAGAFLGSRAVESASASEKLSYTLDGTITGGDNAYAEPSVITQGDVTWDVVANTTMSPWRLGGKGLTQVDRTITSEDVVTSANVTKVEVSVGATGSSLTVNSVSLKVGSTSGGSEIETIAKTSGSLSNTTLTFERSSGKDWTGRYFTIVFNVTRTSTSGNGYVQFNNAKFYEESAVSRGEASIEGLNDTILFVGGSKTLNAGWDPLDSGATVKSYSFSSNNTDVLTFSGDTYTAVAPGKAKVILNLTDSNDEEYVVESNLLFVSNEYGFEVGDNVVLYSAGVSMEMTSIDKSGSNHFGVGTAYTTKPNGTYLLTVEEGNASGSLSFVNDGNYLAWSSGNSLTTKTTKDDNSSWYVVSYDDYDLIINAATTSREIWWNNGTPRFATYEGKTPESSGYNATSLMKIEEAPVRGTITIDNSFGNATKQGAMGTLSYTWTPAEESSATIVSYTWASTNSDVMAVTGDSYEAIGPGKAKITLTATDSNDQEYSVSTGDINVYATVSGSYVRYESVADGDTVAIVCDTVGTQFAGISSKIGTFVFYDGAPADVYDFTLEADGDYFALKNSEDKYLNWTSGTDISFVDEVTDNALWSISITDGDATISNKALDGETHRYIAWNNSSPRFTTYKTGQTAVQLYGPSQEIVISENGLAFINNLLSYTCDDQGQTAPSVSGWSDLEDQYNATGDDSIPAEDKDLFRTITAVEHASPVTDREKVEQAMAKYDYIVGKYNKTLGLTEDYPDFINRDPAALRNIGAPIVDSNSTNTAIIVVSVIAVISVSSIGVLLVLKRRKNHI